MGVRLDKGVLDGERGPVAPLSDEFNSSVLTFVDPITIGFSLSPLFVGRDKSLQKQLLFSGLRRHFYPSSASSRATKPKVAHNRLFRYRTFRPRMDF